MSEVYLIPSGRAIRYAYDTVFDKSVSLGETMYEFQGDKESIKSIRDKMARVALGAADLGKIPAQAAYFFHNNINEAHMIPLGYIEVLDSDAFRQRQVALARGAASGQISFDDVLREQELLRKDDGGEGTHVLDENGIRRYQFDCDATWIYTDSYRDLNERESDTGDTLERAVGAETADIIRKHTTHIAEQHEFLPYNPEESFPRARVKHAGHWHNSYGTLAGDTFIPFVTVLRDDHPVRQAIKAKQNSDQSNPISYSA